VIKKVTCEYRLIGDKEWTGLESIEINQSFTLVPYEPFNMPFKLWIEGMIADSSLRYLSLVLNPLPGVLSGRSEFHHYSIVARHKPIRFRMHFIDVEGQESTRVFEVS
jgi:hypothetical protein